MKRITHKMQAEQQECRLDGLWTIIRVLVMVDKTLYHLEYQRQENLLPKSRHKTTAKAPLYFYARHQDGNTFIGVWPLPSQSIELLIHASKVAA